MISAEFCILHLAISCFSLLGSILAWRYSTTWLFQHDRQHLSSWCDMMWIWIMNIFCNMHKESKEIPTRSNEKLSPISSRFCRVSACRVNSLRRSKSKTSLVLRCYFLDWYNKENIKLISQKVRQSGHTAIQQSSSQAEPPNLTSQV